MNRSYAKKLAQTITNKELETMLNNAKVGVLDWTKASKSNKGISRGTNWNMFCKDFNVNHKISEIIKFRMIEEFGEFLPIELHEPKKKKPDYVQPTHFDPIF